MVLPAGSLNDAKVRRAIREADPPKRFKDFIDISLNTSEVATMDALIDARDVIKYFIALKVRRTGVMQYSDWEVMIALLVPIVCAALVEE